MKRALVVILAAGVGCAVATVIVSKRLNARQAAQLAEQQAAWQAEKADLEAALENARANTHTIVVPGAPAVVAPPAAPVKLSPTEIVAKLRGLKSSPGASQSRNLRLAIYLFEDLIAAGPAALPAIREFLARNEDADFDFASPGQGKGGRGGSVPNDFIFPPSLRFGLFDVVRQIGGAEAGKILAEVLGTTGRAVEVAYLARVLEEMASGKYTEAALTAARDLLARGAPVSNSPLDRFHRDYLYDVLKLHHDMSYVSTAQAQLIQPDGKVDRSALRYLQQSLGPQSVASAAQAYQDPRVKDADARESLARVALAYVGVDPQAEQMFHASLFDPALKPDHRRELVEDLNQDGLSNKKNPSAQDLQIIQSRFELTQAYLQQDYVQQDKVLFKAFNEADKDLRKALERAAAAAAGITLPQSGKGGGQNQRNQ